MNFETHNDIDIEINGTFKQGTIETSYTNLVSKFGKPLKGSRDNNVDVEWFIRFSDGTIANIHNWKDGKAYLGDRGLAIEDIKVWIVGGVNPKAVEYVKQAIRRTI